VVVVWRSGGRQPCAPDDGQSFVRNMLS
jgi:hypothetical protein